jgi:hypothetical protein
VDTLVKSQIEIIDCIPPRLVDKSWRFIREYVEGCVKHMHRGYTSDDIFDALTRGEWSLSLVFAVEGGHSHCLGFYSTCVVIYPQLRALRITALGGRELRRWKRAAMEALGRLQEANRCERVESFGRKGWLRMLPGKFELAYYYIGVDLNSRRGMHG